MSENPAKTINYYGQLFLLVFATICCVLGFIITPISMFLMILLPALSVWQVVDFAILCSKNGYKKWYNWYIGAMIGFVLLLGFMLLLFSDYIPISYNTTISNFYIILIFSCYTIAVAWVYLFYWRRK